MSPNLIPNRNQSNQYGSGSQYGNQYGPSASQYGSAGPMSRTGARFNSSAYNDQSHMTRGQQYGSGGTPTSAGQYRR